ncbi:hypothetical protein SAMN02745244_03573 [Tessaracoccus bendigoensis DSM 12906]|uniref:Uncharacterized protein n=1 Tax=Tessaracoccus bendigoensis DSM 12906 TaxID=1123357 RepID=A0A1M6N7S1_9ACTN|nr:hypothetical protein [Tessaracoccus bendigoensis]SHJ91732.1 hypothetical protein SAMN02745244_03573 [Tessaracoccus bendigoensis DSM 12906]
MVELRAGLWRLELRTRVERLTREAALLSTAPAKEQIKNYLDTARAVATERRTLRGVWFGHDVEEAWRQLREAERLILETTTDPEQTIAKGQTALARGKGRLPVDDSRMTALKAALKTASASGGGSHANLSLRELSADVLIGAWAVSTAEHQVQLRFRTILRSLTLALAILAILAVLVSLRWVVPGGLIPAPKGSPSNMVLVWYSCSEP